MTDPTHVLPPTLATIRAAHARLREFIVETPVWRWRGPEIERRLGRDTEALLKLELLQHTGTFKPRGALTVMLALDPDVLARGVVACSAGNHGLAVAWAARELKTHAVVTMPHTADPGRISGCRTLGATVELHPNMHVAFARADAVAATDQRTLVHPFEGPGTVLGTATLGLEIAEQLGHLDAVIVPVGGGGLAAGIAAAMHELQPSCEVWGVEPFGADTMHRSFQAGRPERLDAVSTIADSLGAPHALPYTFTLCRRLLCGLVRVDDGALREAMRLLCGDAKLAVEPAGAAATAALLGPLRERLRGARVAVVVCGSNIEPLRFAGHLTAEVATARVSAAS